MPRMALPSLACRRQRCGSPLALRIHLSRHPRRNKRMHLRGTLSPSCEVDHKRHTTTNSTLLPPASDPQRSSSDMFSQSTRCSEVYAFPNNSDTLPISRSSLSDRLLINRLASHAPPAQRATLVFVPCQRVLALDACRTQQFLSSAHHPLIGSTVATIAKVPDRHAEYGPMRSGLTAFFARTPHNHSPNAKCSIDGNQQS